MIETTLWFLVIFYDQQWPDQRFPQQNADTEGVYFSREACLRAASRMTIPAYEKSYAGPVVHNTKVVKRCNKGTATYRMDGGSDG
jgi:hypothetical protein